MSKTATDTQQWYPEVVHFCPTTPLILVGLKSDLRHKRTCIELLKTQGLTPVTQEQGQAVANRMNALYMECSSKEMHGVEEIFEKAIDIAVAEDLAAQQNAPGSSMARPRKRKARSCKLL